MVQHDYFKMWDPMTQIPFDVIIYCSDTGAEQTCKMTVKFTDFRGNFVDQCLQNLCQQQSSQTCAQCLVPKNRFHQPACKFELRDPKSLLTFWKYGPPDHLRAYSVQETVELMGE